MPLHKLQQLAQPVILSSRLSKLISSTSSNLTKPHSWFPGLLDLSNQLINQSILISSVCGWVIGGWEGEWVGQVHQHVLRVCVCVCVFVIYMPLCLSVNIRALFKCHIYYMLPHTQPTPGMGDYCSHGCGFPDTLKNVGFFYSLYNIRFIGLTLCWHPAVVCPWPYELNLTYDSTNTLSPKV